MFSFRCAAFVLALAVLPAPLHAGAVKIEGDEPRKHITVTIEAANIDDVLQEFARVYGLEVRGLGKADRSALVSTTLSGSLYAVLGRLLRNENHVIVRSPDSQSGIHSIILIGEGSGSAPPPKQSAPKDD